jgi:hypothetical protein
MFAKRDEEFFEQQVKMGTDGGLIGLAGLVIKKMRNGRAK